MKKRKKASSSSGVSAETPAVELKEEQAKTVRFESFVRFGLSLFRFFMTVVPALTLVLLVCVLLIPMSVTSVGSLTGVLVDETRIVYIIILLVMPAMFMVMIYAAAVIGIVVWWYKRVRAWSDSLYSRYTGRTSKK